MPPLVETFCPHERRPGTAICLRCRREARLATRARQRHMMTWAGGIALSLGVTGVVVVSGATAFTDWRPPNWLQQTMFSIPTSHRTTLNAALPAPVPSTLAAELAPQPMASSGTPAEVPPPIPDPPAGTISTPPLAPIVAEGRTMLRDSVVAVRAGSSVTVHFDTPRARTRRADKFEQIVRTTLPAIYGHAADSLLGRLPPGTFAKAGDLLTELPRRGLRLPVGPGWTLMLWPQTRPGLKGPLVVTYRTLVTR